MGKHRLLDDPREKLLVATQGALVRTHSRFLRFLHIPGSARTTGIPPHVDACRPLPPPPTDRTKTATEEPRESGNPGLPAPRTRPRSYMVPPFPRLLGRKLPPPRVETLQNLFHLHVLQVFRGKNALRFAPHRLYVSKNPRFLHRCRLPIGWRPARRNSRKSRCSGTHPLPRLSRASPHRRSAPPAPNLE